MVIAVNAFYSNGSHRVRFSTQLMSVYSAQITGILIRFECMGECACLYIHEATKTESG